ncbi:MAG: DNA repair protein RadC [Chloroflexi bacterium]|nr:DNA repair protein RadC [Chloroflexota bacterium]
MRPTPPLPNSRTRGRSSRSSRSAAEGRGPGLEYRPLIRDLPTGERPRERLRDYGADSLSNAELLAIVLRVGADNESVLNMAARLLSAYDGLPGLARASFGELEQHHGLGPAKVAQVKASLELGRRLVATQPQDRPTVRSPSDVNNLLGSEMALLEQEEIRVVLLDTRNHVLAIPPVYKGSVNTSLVRMAELFRDAVRQNCPAIILVHNHPSGDPAPSAEDIELTRQAVAAGKLLDIDVLDHLVIGQGRFVSLKEKGLGFG